MALVQKYIVHGADEASSLLPAHVALVNEDGSAFAGGGSAEIADGSITAAKIADGTIGTDKLTSNAKAELTAVPVATASQVGGVKVARVTALVASADAAAAAGEAPTKAEFDKVVALANELKAQLNAMINASRSAGQAASK